MKDGIGENFTREDHPHVASQLFASYAKALEVRGLAAIIGAEELSEGDRGYLRFADAFERQFIGQGENEERSVYETLNLAWDLLSLLPKAALIRVTEDELTEYYKGKTA
jgi:V/A-type H+-transporting ATPase subunit B